MVLHQTDFLEDASITNVVILGTVYQEVHHKNSSVFLRLKNLLRNEAKRFYYFSNEHHKVLSSPLSLCPPQLVGQCCPDAKQKAFMATAHAPAPPTWPRRSQDTYVVQDKDETPNDRNDRAIRTAAQWYMQRVPGKEIVLLTGDADNRNKAASMGLKALTVEAYAAEKVKDTAVLDLIVGCASLSPRSCKPHSPTPGHAAHHALLCQQRATLYERHRCSKAA